MKSDSLVVIGQVKGDFEAKEDNMQKYLKCVKLLTSRFQQILFEKVPRKENVYADMFSKLNAGEPTEGTWVKSLQEKSISTLVSMVEVKYNWTQPIKDFILEEKLPDDEKLVRKIRTTSARYVLVGNQLYRTMGNWLLLKYVNPKERNYVLREIHEGICRSHIGSKDSVNKTMCYGYYWATMKEDSLNLVKTCPKYQIHAYEYQYPDVRVSYL